MSENLPLRQSNKYSGRQNMESMLSQNVNQTYYIMPIVRYTWFIGSLHIPFHLLACCYYQPLGILSIGWVKIQGVSKKSVILKFRFFGTSSDSITKEICNAIINTTATRQLAIILALWEMKFEQMTTVWEKGSR